MQHPRRPVSIGLALLGLVLLASPASAHISLLEPTARYDGSLPMGSKACPCGVGDSNRLCDIPGDRSDPDRSNNVTVLEAGATVTLRFDEYVGHTGRYRVAFDDDGADHDDFNANILEDIVDPMGNDGNAGGSIWEITVTVPDVICDNCTLQLVQMMDGDTSAPVLDPAGRSSYYQCADIEIVAPGSDMGPPPGEDMDNPMMPEDMGGTTTPPTQDMGTTTNPPGNNTSPPINPGPDTGIANGADGGLGNVNGSGSCATANGANLLSFALFALVFVARRRRRV